jgi:hypothetical protein
MSESDISDISDITPVLKQKTKRRRFYELQPRNSEEPI